MQLPAAQSKHITRPCLSYWPAARSVPSWRGHCVSLSIFFFFLYTFLSEYQTERSVPSITQTQCPEKLRFVSTASEYFSRPRILPTHRQRRTGRHVSAPFFPTFSAVNTEGKCFGISRNHVLISFRCWDLKPTETERFQPVIKEDLCYAAAWLSMSGTANV